MTQSKKYYINDEIFEELSLKTYQIWQEGFQIGKNIQKAEYLGDMEGKDFEQSCLKFFKNDPNFNWKLLTFYGAKLWENETDARKKYG